ncbi:MAG: Efflux ABC transporter, ATP-binding protein, partial [uncultured Solirubrobacteraceae bacterium]
GRDHGRATDQAIRRDARGRRPVLHGRRRARDRLSGAQRRRQV